MTLHSLKPIRFQDLYVRHRDFAFVLTDIQNYGDKRDAAPWFGGGLADACGGGIVAATLRTDIHAPCRSEKTFNARVSPEEMARTYSTSELCARSSMPILSPEGARKVPSASSDRGSGESGGDCSKPFCPDRGQRRL